MIPTDADGKFAMLVEKFQQNFSIYPNKTNSSNPTEESPCLKTVNHTVIIEKEFTSLIKNPTKSIETWNRGENVCCKNAIKTSRIGQ